MSTRLLLVIAHFFKPDEKGHYSSTSTGMRDVRRKVLEQVLLHWRSRYNPPQTIDISVKCFRPSPVAPAVSLDIAILLHENNHLLTEDMVSRYRLRPVAVQTNNPRQLPFAAHQLMADSLGDYDWMAYSEDDLLIHDPLWLTKMQAFAQAMGPGRVLQPNRYEINPRAAAMKTYIDGDLRHGLTDPFFERVPDQLELSLDCMGQRIPLARARNPHAGFFVLSAEQVRHWKAQPHFMDMDASFISPLESAASLGLQKTFALYKAQAPFQDHFEIEHLDRKFSSLNLPTL
jgi:hypothetical protein